MSNKAIQFWTWTARVVALLGLVAGVLAAAEKLPEWFRDYTAIAVALLGVSNGWIRGFLPAVPSKLLPAMLILFGVLLLAWPACKVPPLATAYRGHALLLTARDGAGETLAKVQRAKMLRCEAEHKPPAEGWRVALKGCYEDVRKPVRAWTKHMRPALTACAAALWLVLELVYVAGKKELDKTAKATAAACATFTAAEMAIKTYADQLGALKAAVIVAVAGGKVLVCR